MRLAMLFLAAFALGLLIPSSVNEASAHGGSYRGPVGEVPPGQRDPKDPQPPPRFGRTSPGSTAARGRRGGRRPGT